jgi:hypothetical protein
MDSNALSTALNTIAQCAAALAALIGFFGMWRLDRHREEARRLEQAIVEVTILSTQDSPTRGQLLGHGHYLTLGRQLANDGHTELAPLYKQFDTLPSVRRRLLCVLISFLITMLCILVLAVISFIFIVQLQTWAWTPWLIGFAGFCLGIGPAWVIMQASQYKEREHGW